MEAEEFLDRLCDYSSTTRVWRALHRGGGAYTWTEIHRFTGVSSSTLSNALLNLLADDLVRLVNGKYQAVIPKCIRDIDRDPGPW